MAIERPANVPADSIREDDAWAHGEKVGDEKHGEWRYWRDNGELFSTEQWGDGTASMTYERYHPDGALSQRGAKDLVKDVWIGSMRWERQPAASPEDVYFPRGTHEAVRAYELVLDDDGYIVEER